MSDNGSDAPRWARFVRPERYEGEPPERTFDLLGIGGEEAVLDLGCGPGFFTLPLLSRLAQNGKVYALDACADSIRALENRAGEDARLVTLCCEFPPAPIEQGALDLVWGANVLHELGETAVALSEIYALLRPGGRIVMVDWYKVPTQRGPRFEDRIAAKDAAQALVKAGFERVVCERYNDWKYMVSGYRGTRLT